MVAMKHKQKLTHQQQGMVSIIVVMVMMGIMVLVATSFALLMRREERQALDRQLSTQAFYAAESGIHDVAAKISTFTSDVTNCNDPRVKNGNQNLDSAGVVAYTCVLINRSPDSLLYDPLPMDSSTVVRLESPTGAISRIDISWRDDSKSGTGNKFLPAGGANGADSHPLPQKNIADARTANLTASDGTGMVRATIMPIRNPNNITRDQLVADAKTYFLYPKENTAAANAFSSANGASNNAYFLDGNCNSGSTPYYCNTRITNLQGTNNGVIYLRLKSLYKETAVNIRIYNNGVQSKIANAQAVIDSTGRANDVLRRIQVRIPLKGGFLVPDFAIESMDTICKRMAFSSSTSAPDIEMPIEDPNTSNTVGNVYYNNSLDRIVCDPAQG